MPIQVPTPELSRSGTRASLRGAILEFLLRRAHCGCASGTAQRVTAKKISKIRQDKIKTGAKNPQKLNITAQGRADFELFWNFICGTQRRCAHGTPTAYRKDRISKRVKEARSAVLLDLQAGRPN